MNAPNPNPNQSLDKNLGLGAAFLAALSWGLAGTFVRLVPGVPADILVALRLWITLMALLPVVVGNHRMRALLRSALHSGPCWRLATAMVVYYMLSTAAFQHAAVNEVSLFISTAPLLVLAYRMLRRQPIHRWELWGGTFAFLGILVLGLGSHASGLFLHPWKGWLFALGAACVIACYATLGNQLHIKGQNPGALILVLMTSLLGTCLLIPFFLKGQLFTLATLVAHHPWPLLGLGALATALPTFCYAIASKELSPVLAAAINPVTAILATAAAWLILGERPSPWFLPAAVLVFSGVVLMMRGVEAKTS